jgi:hypothetical protein
MQCDPFPCLRILEVSTNFTDWPAELTMPELALVPFHTQLVPMTEEYRFLDPSRQTDVALENIMEPGGAGSWRSDREKIGQSARRNCHHRASFSEFVIFLFSLDILSVKAARERLALLLCASLCPSGSLSLSRERASAPGARG